MITTKMQVKKMIKGISKEIRHNKEILHLTAYENQLSNTARSFLSSEISYRYYFGGGKDEVINWDPFTCLGLPELEKLVKAATASLLKMTGGSVATLNCLSGVHAMIATILSTTDVGDVIMTVHHDDGGHFATKGIIELAGRKHCYATYNYEDNNFDPLEISKTIHKNKVKLLYLDISYCIDPINLYEMRQNIGNKCLIAYDASHTLGLIMSGKFQSPLKEGADILVGNTHKTLPGPQKALIVVRERKLGERMLKIISSSLHSSVHTHHLIALCITILEMQQYGQSYGIQMILNSNALGKALEDLGYQVRKSAIGNYSNNHQIHLYIDNADGKKYDNLIRNNISTNFDNRLGGKLFARLGTQEVTRRGMKEVDMKKIAQYIDQALKGKSIKNEIISFNKKYKKIKYSFDE